MLENCNTVPGSSKHSQTVSEYRAQFSTFAILTSPLILGNVSALPITFWCLTCDVMSCVELGLACLRTQDPRNMSKACLDIIANKEIIALSAPHTHPAPHPRSG